MIMFDEESGRVFNVPEDVIEKHEMEPAEVQELMQAIKADDSAPEADEGDVKGYWSACWTRKRGSFSWGGRSYSWRRRTYCIGGWSK